LRSSSTRRSSRDSGAQAKRMEFAVGTGVFQQYRPEPDTHWKPQVSLPAALPESSRASAFFSSIRIPRAI
jgi:hypothetical protein